MRLLRYVSILRSCRLSRKEKMKTPICVLRCSSTPYMTIADVFQQVDVFQVPGLRKSYEMHVWWQNLNV